MTGLGRSQVIRIHDDPTKLTTQLKDVSNGRVRKSEADRGVRRFFSMNSV